MVRPCSLRKPKEERRIIMSGQVPTVFIVEDSPEVRGALVRILSVGGYAVRTFDSAELFLEQCDTSAPGCLLLDFCLPGLSGLELQSELQRLNCGWPIIFLTGMGDVHVGVNAMKGGAVDFLTNPIEHGHMPRGGAKPVKRV